MIILKPSVVLVQATPYAEDLIEQAGRTAYQSERKDGSAPAFVKMLITRGHESVLEHASATLRFICDRGVTHEMVRHRIASYTQESTRYCCYKEEIQVIEPPFKSDSERAVWRTAMMDAERAYHLLLKTQTPQIARSVLPTCLKTDIITTYNFREWRHFLRLRCAKTAHPQMREVAFMALEIMKKLSPTCFGDLNDNPDTV